jgi:peptide/nickel transport system substrate-binding protein
MKKRFLIYLTVLGLLCGCGEASVQKGGADSNTTPTPVASQTNAPEEQQTPKTPIEGGSITVGITQDLDSLDPHVAVAAGTDEVLFNLFEGLVKADEKGVMNPAVAESYTISDDAKTYTFTLRDNVKFHNGNVVTTEDVVYSLKRCAGFTEAKDPNVLVESALSIVSDIYAPDDRTVVVALSEPNTELIYYLTCAIIPKDYKNQATAPIGTGPFKFVSYAPLQSFVIEKNNDYYGEKAHLDKVTFKIFANVDSAFMELLAGSIDLMTQLQADQCKQLEDKYNIVAANYNLVQALFLNNEFEPFKSTKVRQALCYAINRDEINQMISEGKGTIIGSGMFPGISEYFAEDLVDYYTFDQAKAQNILDLTNYDKGLSFTIKIPSSYDSHVATGQIIVEQLKKMGITAKIETVEWSTWLTDVYRNRNFEATIIGLDANLAPSDILKRYNSTAKNNFINYNNVAFDACYKNAVEAVNIEDKKNYYHKCQEILTKNAASVFIQDPAQLTAVKKGLEGYTPYPIYVFDASKLYFVK